MENGKGVVSPREGGEAKRQPKWFWDRQIGQQEDPVNPNRQM